MCYVTCRIKIPSYGYVTPVRCCKYCFELLDDAVLCDFDTEDIDEEQWQSVHMQTAANPENLGNYSNKLVNNPENLGNYSISNKLVNNPENLGSYSNKSPRESR